MKPILLASASPRRTQLLDQIRVPHQVRPVDIDETRRTGEAPGDYVVRLARMKARALWDAQSEPKLPVLGADTTVALGAVVFEKPKDRDDGMRMLAALSGRTHQVFTAVALCAESGCHSRLSQSSVSFGPLSAADCDAYWATGEPLGKAGGYAVQGLAAAFITRIEGSYSGIMGLPLAETVELLREAGGWRL
jgi:septum formation protein